MSRLFQHSREDSPATVDPSFETSSIGENSQHVGILLDLFYYSYFTYELIDYLINVMKLN